MGISYPMIRLQVIDLFSEHQHPKIFAEELYYVEGICEAWAIFAESKVERSGISFVLSRSSYAILRFGSLLLLEPSSSLSFPLLQPLFRISTNPHHCLDLLPNPNPFLFPLPVLYPFENLQT